MTIRQRSMRRDFYRFSGAAIGSRLSELRGRIEIVDRDLGDRRMTAAQAFERVADAGADVEVGLLDRVPAVEVAVEEARDGFGQDRDRELTAVRVPREDQPS